MEKSWKQLLSPEMAHLCTYENSFESAIQVIEDGEKKGVLMCMKNVPFDRKESIHIAAVLPLQDRGFYLTCRGTAKNLFLLGESQTIHYTHDFIPFYVRDFNSKVQLKKITADEVGNYEFEVTTEKTDQSIELNKQEFIPENGEGIYVVLCKKSDIDFRQKLMAFHDEATMEISNLQRMIESKCQDKKLKGIFIQKDDNGHLHGSLAYGDKAIQYITYSQSTTHEFCENFIKKM